MTLRVLASEPAPRPGMVVIEAWGYRCHRCSYEWFPREAEPPRVCPQCKSPYWDRPRKRDVAIGGKP